MSKEKKKKNHCICNALRVLLTNTLYCFDFSASGCRSRYSSMLRFIQTEALGAKTLCLGREATRRLLGHLYPSGQLLIPQPSLFSTLFWRSTRYSWKEKGNCFGKRKTKHKTTKKQTLLRPWFWSRIQLIRIPWYWGRVRITLSQSLSGQIRSPRRGCVFRVNSLFSLAWHKPPCDTAR